jgi:hypothetical protein
MADNQFPSLSKEPVTEEQRQQLMTQPVQVQRTSNAIVVTRTPWRGEEAFREDLRRQEDNRQNVQLAGNIIAAVGLGILTGGAATAGLAAAEAAGYGTAAGLAAQGAGVVGTITAAKSLQESSKRGIRGVAEEAAMQVAFMGGMGAGARAVRGAIPTITERFTPKGTLEDYTNTRIELITGKEPVFVEVKSRPVEPKPVMTVEDILIEKGFRTKAIELQNARGEPTIYQVLEQSAADAGLRRMEPADLSLNDIMVSVQKTKPAEILPIERAAAVRQDSIQGISGVIFPYPSLTTGAGMSGRGGEDRAIVASAIDIGGIRGSIQYPETGPLQYNMGDTTIATVPAVVKTIAPERPGAIVAPDIAPSVDILPQQKTDTMLQYMYRQRQRREQQRPIVKRATVIANIQDTRHEVMFGTTDPMVQQMEQGTRQSTEERTMDITGLPTALDLQIFTSGGPMMPAGKSYIVQAKERTYSKGKKISAGRYNNIVDTPLSYDDAVSLGMDTVGKNEKASFILIPSEEKPRKLKRKVPDWRTQENKFYQKDGRWVEKNFARIDSPGELNAITRKGIAARRRK